MVNAKVRAILANGMTPIMACGETLDEREAGSAETKVQSQVVAGLAQISADQVADLVIAYEPIWAIGTGVTASSTDAEAMCAHVRRVVGDNWGGDAAESVRIQYGGSVKGGNAAELMSQPDIDGALVGGASLDADEFTRIVQHRLL
jgi:triosephosphate isomerase